MSSTEPDNTHTDSGDGTDTTALPSFGPLTAEEILDQLNVQLSAKEKDHLVFVADSAKIEQDYQAALAINAEPSILRHHEELKQAHQGLHEQFLREWIELVQQSRDMNIEAKARVEEEKEALKKELMARKETMKKMEEKRARLREKARVKEEKARAKEEWKKASREKIAMLEAQTARVIRETKKKRAVLIRENAVARVEVEARKIEHEVLKARNAEIKAETRMYKNELLEIYLYRWIADLD
ncbi:uncharacterized protein J4E78_001496 [Alternaria triticimaculans]|uniref:uncharacterized protein n=1 Tax=Alternaria triticimaculans TaxID=297637 RepID=UPI0020C44A99|nr:uncharacterized protein J4E78_001496 [Alternaria triticimaculans]KAI4672993.1 hypothetical protein J4E78_001496 [Alternaria triticimaculans]